MKRSESRINCSYNSDSKTKKQTKRQCDKDSNRVQTGTDRRTTILTKVSGKNSAETSGRTDKVEYRSSFDILKSSYLTESFVYLNQVA